MRVTDIIRLIAHMSLTLLISFSAHAYDGDVDYSAPYVTIDPETGKLVTIDPKAQTKTPHETSGNSTATVSTNSETIATTPPSTTTSLTAATTEMPSTNLSDNQNDGVNPAILIGLLLTGFIAAFIYRNKGNKQTNDSSTDQTS